MTLLPGGTELPAGGSVRVALPGVTGGGGGGMVASHLEVTVRPSLVMSLVACVSGSPTTVGIVTGGSAAAIVSVIDEPCVTSPSLRSCRITWFRVLSLGSETTVEFRSEEHTS